MHYIKITLTGLLLTGTVFSLIYSLFLLIRFLKKGLNKSEVIKKTFWVTFCGWMSMFLAYFVWHADWNITYLILFLSTASLISFIGAISFVASFLRWKD